MTSSARGNSSPKNSSPTDSSPENLSSTNLSSTNLSPTNLSTVVNLCKRRGFVFPSAEIYGGFRSAYDFGPPGVLLLRNIKEAWWRSIVQLRDDVVGLEASILSPPQVWEASGHLESFTDPLVECRKCNTRHRQDHLTRPDCCPLCGTVGELTDPRQFNLMFKTTAGPVEEEGSAVFLRPETAQGMFINYALIAGTTRKKPPFGIAQIGKSFRNEITPGNFIFRTREFEQMEMEFFVPPAESKQWFDYWCQARLDWYKELGIPEQLLRLREHTPEELSHYSSATSDVEFNYPWGWGELEGIAHRGDYDLNAHASHSGATLDFFDQSTQERFVPHVIEPAAGATRAFLAFLLAAYDEETVKGETRTVLRLHPALAPYDVAVLPLSRKEPLLGQAQQTADSLRPHFMVDFDETQSIGRRYRRQDELGTPLCVTIDFETSEDNSATIRERDEMTQVRVPLSELPGTVAKMLGRSSLL